MPRISPVVSLADVDRERLERWIAAYGTPQQVALRCRIVVAATTGRTNLKTIRFVGTVGNQIDAEFTLGMLDRGVYLARRYAKTLGE